MNPEVPEWTYAGSNPEALLESARKARILAYAPYSNFKVGAAVLTDTGKVVCGCNIENSSLSLTLCAERVAIFSAVSSGSGKPVAVAIAGEKGLPCIPCGACLQVLAEFNGDFRIVLESEGAARVYRLDDLLPLRFRLKRNNP
jgi:cytidine deaminase, homotetrameric